MLGRGPDRMKRGCFRVSPMGTDVMKTVAAVGSPVCRCVSAADTFSLSLSLSTPGLAGKKPSFGAPRGAHQQSRPISQVGPSVARAISAGGLEAGAPHLRVGGVNVRVPRVLVRPNARRWFSPRSRSWVGGGAILRNRQVADAAQVIDQGQISELLARLEGVGLITNTRVTPRASPTPGISRLAVKRSCARAPPGIA